MQVICNHSQDCPLNYCIHKEVHENFMEIDPIGKIQTYCETAERICGLRFPKERVKVICQPIKKTRHSESVRIEQPEAVAV